VGGESFFERCGGWAWEEERRAEEWRCKWRGGVRPKKPASTRVVEAEAKKPKNQKNKKITIKYSN